ncbi:MAG: homocysteine S-methyltransferase family protein [Candidatus Krumholzibacteria bacterium]|nr:homocysteine S-methyltransferase family protein [Candidatus Krumholzibacteria bacterium]
MSRYADLRERLANGGVILDGGLGTMLIARGLQSGAPPEQWNHSQPATLQSVHKAYLEAGSDIISTNTFGASPSRLQTHGLDDQLRSINTAGVKLARAAVTEFCDSKRGGRAADTQDQVVTPVKFVALSLGPTGKMLPPVGQASEDEIREEFTEQIRSIDASFDLVLIETVYDLREGIAALQVAKHLLGQPVAVSLTYNVNPRGFFTVMGDEAAAAVKRLEEAGADVVGANCSLSSGEMIDLARLLRRTTDLPILCQPNAGNPKMSDRVPVYDQTPGDFAEDALRIFEAGANAVGGCCGTTPDFIRELSTRLR